MRAAPAVSCAMGTRKCAHEHSGQRRTSSRAQDRHAGWTRRQGRRMRCAATEAVAAFCSVILASKQERVATRSMREISPPLFYTGQTISIYRSLIARTFATAWDSEVVAMGVTGAVFQPELIELMKAVLDDAAAMLPEWKRTSSMKAEIATHILECAAKGERDPVALRTAALLAIVECTHYSHDISSERRAV